MKDESIRYCIKFSKSFDVADVPEAESELTAMQARIEKLETAANKAVEWLHHYPSPDNMEEQMVMNAKRARGILEEALK